MEMLIPQMEDQQFNCKLITSIPTKDSLFPDAESIDHLIARVQSFIHEVNKKHQGQTIITVTHGEPATVTKKVFKDFDYLTKRDDYYTHNRNLTDYVPDIRYRDNDRNTEVDLHKPYIDSYRFKKGSKEYRRIPEVMDCRFESGSMPFGQVGCTSKDDPKLIYPADFIIEGLDQTRGRFRTLHVVGNAVMGKNSFDNVIINGMILAEDGKKMSKKLKNYPDPEYLFHKYGSDAYRLYMLSSPGVRAEPVKFSEKGVDQIYKDFTAAILNAYKFFETYAKVDNFSYKKPTVYFLRHGEGEGQEPNAKLTENAKTNMKSAKFVEEVLRVQPEIIYSSSFLRAQETAKAVQDIMKEYLGKKVKIKIDETLSNENAVDTYKKLLKKSEGNILIVSHLPQFQNIRKEYYMDDKDIEIHREEFVKLPTHKITNELDKRILAELNNL
jgi:broad specificity phosphatase PhoE